MLGTCAENYANCFDDKQQKEVGHFVRFFLILASGNAAILQYDARDKFLFCLVLGRRTSESAAIVISVRRKSAANLARFAAETLVFCGMQKL